MISYTSVREVRPTTLSKAKLHWLEFLDWKDRDDSLIPIEVRNGGPWPGAPRRSNPLQVLTPKILELHTVGAIRALATALDCLAGTIVAIVALPTNILRADFKRVRRKLINVRNHEASNSIRNEEIQAQLSKVIDGLIDQHGPSGWVEWMLDYRNMVVHRGRRLHFGQILPVESSWAGWPRSTGKAAHIPTARPCTVRCGDAP